MKLLIAASLRAVASTAFANLNFVKDRSVDKFDEKKFSDQISKMIFENDAWPDDVKLDDKKYKVYYTFDDNLLSYVKQKLKQYGSDHASVVVINNNNGKVLSAVDYSRGERGFGKVLALSSTSPAASIFKVITAADLLEKTNVNKDTEFAFNGRSATLYKYQLKDDHNRWTRTVRFGNAFAKSNNVVFGKAAISKLSNDSLHQRAEKFGFSQPLLQLVDVQSTHIKDAEDTFSLAELASGFNKQTLISPLHGAIIASIIANDGMFRTPALISSVIDEEQRKVVWEPQYVLQRSISAETAKELKDMMQLTVELGTARSAFRRISSKSPLKDIEIGGKTGSITGGEPFGKRDWFVAYAKPKDDEHDKGISICVMNVNVKKWYVKSSFLAKEIIQHYYDSLNQ